MCESNINAFFMLHATLVFFENQTDLNIKISKLILSRTITKII